MKKNFKAPMNASKMYQTVSIDRLETSGESNHMVSFKVGDTIEFPENEEQSQFSIRMWRKSEVCYVSVFLNGNCLYVPTGSFRRIPIEQDREVYKTTSPIAWGIYELGNDAVRMRHLYGKTLKVTGICEFRAPLFENNKPVLDETGLIKGKPSKFAIFEEV